MRSAYVGRDVRQSMTAARFDLRFVVFGFSCFSRPGRSRHPILRSPEIEPVYRFIIIQMMQVVLGVNPVKKKMHVLSFRAMKCNL